LRPRGDATVEQDAGAAQGTVSEADRNTADDVVHHFVPICDPQRISAGVAIDLDAKHLIVGLR